MNGQQTKHASFPLQHFPFKRKIPQADEASPSAHKARTVDNDSLEKAQQLEKSHAVRLRNIAEIHRGRILHMR